MDRQGACFEKSHFYYVKSFEKSHFYETGGNKMKNKDTIAYVLTENLLKILHAYEELDVIDILIIAKVYYKTIKVNKSEYTISDQTFAHDFNISDRSIRRRIKTLVDLRLLERETSYEGSLGAINKNRKLSLGPSAVKYLIPITENATEY